MRLPRRSILSAASLSLLVSCQAVLEDAEQGVEWPVNGGDPFSAESQSTPSKVADLDVWGSVSPDGQWLAFVDWSTGDLAVRELGTGQDRRLTNKGSWLESGEFGMFPAFSPGGERIAYTWFNRDGFWDLRIIGVAGGEPRVLLASRELPFVEPQAWSPDGTYILTTLSRADHNNELALVSAQDGSVRLVKQLDWRVPGRMCFASDGEYIVYDLLTGEDATTRDIYVSSTRGSRDLSLVEHPADDLLLGCSQDGQHVVFASDRSGTWDMWNIEVSVRGEATGTPELLQPELGAIIRGLGSTLDGSVYYGVQSGSTDLYVASLDPTTAQLKPPRQLAKGVLFNSAPEWSPDGSRLAYVAHRGESRSGLLYSLVFSILSVEGGGERQFPLKMTTFGGHAFELEWSTDGSFVAAQGRDHLGRMGFYRIDPETGKVEPAVQSEACPPDCLEWLALSPDGTWFFTRWIDDGQILVARNVALGEERLLFRATSPVAIGSLASSPDGRNLAFLSRDGEKRTVTLKVMPVTGGEPRHLLAVQAPVSISALAWMPRSTHILYTTTDAEGRSELWRVAAAGDEPQKLGPLTEGLRLYGLSIHPDGQRIAFTAGALRGSEVWMLSRRQIPEIGIRIDE